MGIVLHVDPAPAQVRLDDERDALDLDGGSRRIWRGDAWYWDLKPDYTPSEVVEN